MSEYICVDAGGSKCLAIRFNDRFELLGEGISGGVNTTSTTIEDSRANVIQCLDQLFSGGAPARVERAFISFVGPRDVLNEELERRAPVAEYQSFGEGLAGLLAGSVRRSGLTALSGTGSDVFYVVDGVNVETVGGWGPILGDEGSGAWIGQQAAQAFVRAQEGWGEETALTSMIFDAWGLEKDWDMVPMVYGSPSPFRKVASLVPLVCRAAAMGDQVAVNILTEAGVYLAKQMIALIECQSIPEDQWQITCCGSVWKGNPVMISSFASALRERGYPCRVKPSWFDPIMAGVALMMLEAGMEPDAARALMERNFSDYAAK